MTDRADPHTLSEREVRSKSKTGLYGDRGNPNLYLKVTSGGTKSWVFRYWRDGRRYALGLGSYPYITLAAARGLAHHHRNLRLGGDDPMTAKRAKIAAGRVAKAKAMSFEECAVAYVAAHEAGWRDQREGKLWTASLGSHVYPAIGKLPVDAIDLPLVLRVIEPLWQTKTTTAARVRRRIENVLDWATVRGYRKGDNPARWKGHLDQVLPKERKVAKVEHHEALPYSEMGAFMAELRNDEKLSARALEFAILTATRAGEVVGATWSEFDLEARTWAIPAERMKAAREHRVPLSDAALALLRALPRTGDRVFSVSRTIVWYAVKRIRPEITVHGFRSSFRDWAGERTGFAREVVEQCLAHAAGDQTELAYRRGDALEKRRQVMDAWAKFCAQPVGTGDNVRSIRAGG
jgi:integrase